VRIGGRATRRAPCELPGPKLSALPKASGWRLAVACGILAVACSGCFGGGSASLVVRVKGSQLVDAQGQPLRLLGVDRSGTEYACIEHLGIFAGPTDGNSIAAMKSWDINAVRLPLNEDCWLGINGAPVAFSGRHYRAAIEQYVRRLNQAGLFVILDLHWSAPGADGAYGQQPMADLDHAPAFWSSVARAFKSDPAVVFDLFNEPYGISWSCWLAGCQLPDGWRTAGMQTLVYAVRSTGARQPIIATGIGWGNNLTSWLRYEPYDPDNQLIAGFHAYGWLSCSNVTCWRNNLLPVAQVVPIVTTELGEGNCSGTFITQFMKWADASDVSYLGWSWNPAGCSAPALIRSWDGQPTNFGASLRANLLALASGQRRPVDRMRLGDRSTGHGRSDLLMARPVPVGG